MAAKKDKENGSSGRCSQLWGGVGNGVTEEDLCQDLNEGAAAMLVLTTQFWEHRGGSLDHVA